MDYLIAPERHESDGFVLRSYDVGDGALLSDAVNESYDHLRPWMPWAKPHQSVEESRKLVRQFRARYLLSEDFVIGVFSANDQRLLGGAGFHLREGPLSTACAEIGMSWARGGATRHVTPSPSLNGSTGSPHEAQGRARFLLS